MTPEELIADFWPHFDRYLRSQFRRMRYPDHMRDDARSFALSQLWRSAQLYAASENPGRPWAVRARVSVKWAIRRYRRKQLTGYVLPDSGVLLGGHGRVLEDQRGWPEPVSTYDPYPRMDAAMDVRGEVARLPDKYAYVLRRHYLDDWTFDEIAAEAGCTRQYVHALEVRALRQIRKSMARISHHTPALSGRLRGSKGLRVKRATIGNQEHQHATPVQPYASRGARAVAT